MELSKASKALNLDANASFGLLPEVSEALRQHLPSFLNPSSIHRGGQAARALLEETRAEIVATLGLSRDERVIFTSGATESNNMALQLPFWRAGTLSANCDLIVSAVEHPSVLEPARRLQSLGHRLGVLEPSADFSLSTDKLSELVAKDTKLLSVMCANNETGHIYPVAELAACARSINPEILVHCDAVQALGKMPLSFATLGVDMLSLSGHKIGALSGTGALIVSQRVACKPLLSGGPQEARWRAGTENVVGIFSFGVALRTFRATQETRIQRMLEGRDFFAKVLLSELSNIRINSSRCGLPNTLNVTIAGVRADDLVVALDTEGILISSGAACASGKPEPSHVLLALGLDPEAARQSVRLSLNAMSGPGELAEAAQKLISAVRRMRGVPA